VKTSVIMSETVAIALMLNNYLHDVATAFLFSSAAITWFAYRKLSSEPSRAEGLYFVKIFKSMTRLAVASLMWIVVGGIPRTIFYKQFEWSAAAGRGQVPVLLAKHVVAFIFLSLGIAAWCRMKRLGEELEKAS
jgi:uncharacterized membrane protein